MSKARTRESLVQIAIDGPVAAGKGTVARILAERLGWLYVDTGAMYRAAALLARRAGVSFEDSKAIASLVDRSHFEMRNPTDTERDGRLTTLVVDGEDVSWKIRTEEFSRGASMVAAHQEVRRSLVEKQQKIATLHNVVMEGRDITFRVLPKAQLKIFLTASEEERAKRRHHQLIERGVDADYNTVLDDLRTRDWRDSERGTDPLHIVEDAWVFDTTGMKISEVVERILDKVRPIISGSNN
ncbi:MAG: cytidylate kinase [Candidatus Chisholmbacteria bacterium RIFCSPHIGHO2_01_FULL_49_18]|uniref:Cytidylate kinase n=2 Tax=Candidatus Chisholmiibacteriota TaxID=1817900 RepID=A0A1G1VP36_9BACT|nr:MAG: cytidylate kinase [Candidatus Chisholmbacteria bacterium RIFCSPHIGHO2_01_FULL_49_18]OGY21152.1 MAG: cytidylate kinase [Candidatus Chisholmbacteria bacterium RIFCSPLOWO2_01_FULL_49_14]